MSFQYQLSLVSPLLVLCLGALVLLLAEVFCKPGWPKGFVTAVVLVVSGVCAQLVIPFLQGGKTVFSGLVYVDPFGSFITIILILGSLLALFLGYERLGSQGISASGEYYALFLFSTAGAVLFVNAAELVTLFVGLEVMSMSLYCLCGSSLHSKRSSESALKYFLLGSFSSAFLLYGIALLYGLTGTMSIEVIGAALPRVHSPILHFAMGLMLVGLVFKIGAVPFHFWAPDVYEGAPTSVTAYMACVIKAAAFAAALRVLWTAFDQVAQFWSGAVWVMAVLTMTVGNVVAIRQRNIKRMLAYSSIAHAGYLMVAFLAPEAQFGGGSAILYYLLSYTLMTMGAFGVVLVLGTRKGAPSGDEAYAGDITRFNGLGSTRPALAALMTLFILSLAGIPPGFAGFLGKFYIFGAAVKANYVGLVIIGVLNSAISCYYYLRVIVAMYFIDPDSAEQEGEPLPLGLPLASALSICAMGILFFGLFPSVVHESAVVVMQSFH